MARKRPIRAAHQHLQNQLRGSSIGSRLPKPRTSRILRARGVRLRTTSIPPRSLAQLTPTSQGMNARRIDELDRRQIHNDPYARGCCIPMTAATVDDISMSGSPHTRTQAVNKPSSTRLSPTTSTRNGVACAIAALRSADTTLRSSAPRQGARSAKLQCRCRHGSDEDAWFWSAHWARRQQPNRQCEAGAPGWAVMSSGVARTANTPPSCQG